jgi:hypothetical protein
MLELEWGARKNIVEIVEDVPVWLECELAKSEPVISASNAEIASHKKPVSVFNVPVFTLIGDIAPGDRLESAHDSGFPTNLSRFLQRLWGLPHGQCPHGEPRM